MMAPQYEGAAFACMSAVPVCGSEEPQDFQEIMLEGAGAESCGAGYLISRISSNGDINPCPMMRLRLGNVVDQPFNEAFSGPLYRVLENAHSPSPARCSGCSLAPLCGRCHAAASVWGRTAGCWWEDTPLADALASQG